MSDPRRVLIKRAAKVLMDRAADYGLDVADPGKMTGWMFSEVKTKAIQLELGGIVAIHETLIEFVRRLNDLKLAPKQSSHTFMRMLAGVLAAFTNEMPPEIKGQFLGELIKLTLDADAFVENAKAMEKKDPGQ